MTPLFGHDAAVAAFRAGLDSGRLHHAWLLAGPKGIGKALFADKAALRVLAERGAGRRARARRARRPSGRPADRRRQPSRSDAARAAGARRAAPASSPASSTSSRCAASQRLFATTASMSPWRVVVIDAIDDLERGAANALLKNLEEPPPTPLPAGQPRARAAAADDPLALPPAALLAARRRRHDVSACARRFPMRSEARSPRWPSGGGRAGPGARLARARRRRRSTGRWTRWSREGDPTNARRSALAQSLALKSAQPRYEAFLARAPVAHRRGGAAAARAALWPRRCALWERAHDLAGSAQRLSLDPQSTVFELAGCSRAGARRRRTPSSREGFIARCLTARRTHGRALLHHHRDQLSQRARRISAMPMRRSRPTRSRASSG